jgi:hypothetical protein
LIFAGEPAKMLRPVLMKSSTQPASAEELIALAQKLARDAERHAILSQSLATQADRLMVAGLRLLDRPRSSAFERPALHS